MAQSGVRFHEVMAGHLARPETGDTGRMPFRLSADVVIEDLDAFLSDASHKGRLVGTIDFGDVGRDLPAEGHVELFTAGSGSGERLMRYQAAFASGGRRFRMVGTKHVTREHGFNAWGHTTTLFTTVTEDRSGEGPATVAAGIIRITLWQGARLLMSLRPMGGASLGARAGTVMAFAGFFVRQVMDVYVAGGGRRQNA